MPRYRTRRLDYSHYALNRARLYTNKSLKALLDECTGTKYCICISTLDARSQKGSGAVAWERVQDSLGYLEVLESHYGFNFKDGTSKAFIFMETKYEPEDEPKGRSDMDYATKWCDSRQHATVEDNYLSTIKNRINEILDKIKPNDLVYFSFNGHGHSDGRIRLGAKGGTHGTYKQRKVAKAWFQDNLFDKAECTVLGIYSCCSASSKLKFKEHYRYKRIMIAAISEVGVTNSWFDRKLRYYLKKTDLPINRMIGQINVDRVKKPEFEGMQAKSVLYATGNEPSRGPEEMVPKITKRAGATNALRDALQARLAMRQQAA